jgi:hypothetical protein
LWYEKFKPKRAPQAGKASLDEAQRQELKEFIEELEPSYKFLFDLFCWHRRKGNRPNEREKFDVALEWDEITKKGNYHEFKFMFECK